MCLCVCVCACVRAVRARLSVGARADRLGKRYKAKSAIFVWVDGIANKQNNETLMKNDINRVYPGVPLDSPRVATLA